jgi:hypothetical protein
VHDLKCARVDLVVVSGLSRQDARIDDVLHIVC